MLEYFPLILRLTSREGEISMFCFVGYFGFVVYLLFKCRGKKYTKFKLINTNTQTLNIKKNITQDNT